MTATPHTRAAASLEACKLSGIYIYINSYVHTHTYIYIHAFHFGGEIKQSGRQ